MRRVAERPAEVAALRAALREAVEASSLRAVAAEIGMSFNGLRSFIAGGSRKPQAATVQKVRHWYGKTRGASLEQRLLSALLNLSAAERRKLPAGIREYVEELRRRGSRGDSGSDFNPE